MKDLTIAIAGAGIGGLTAAVALQREGFTVRVYEQAPKLMQVGAGLSLSPTAAHGLRHLGLGKVLDAEAYPPEDQFMRHYADGHMLMRVNRGRELMRRFGERYYLIHRADLHQGLAEAVRAHDPQAIRLGQAVQKVTSTGPRVEFELADGTHASADALVAADGQRSIVRQQLFSPAPPQFTGYVAWRALIPMERLPGIALEPRSGIYIGPGHMVNVYPVQRGRAMNLVAFAERSAWTEEGWSIPSTVAELLDEFHDWHGEVRAILAAIPEGSLFKWGLFDREPIEDWKRGHVVLLGDAAHPVLPFLGHGAVLAIEDGVVLGRAFAAAASVPEALQRYERARRERATFVFNESRNAVRVFHAAQPDEFSHRVGDVPVDEGLGLFAYDPVLCPV
ncbi:MAG: FAD-dependent monooxygenase [Steroidobacteraceae bacterium]